MRADALLPLLALILVRAAPPPANFLCNRYATFCETFLDAVSCVPGNATVSGCGGPGVNGSLAYAPLPPPDANAGSCACSSPLHLNDASEALGPTNGVGELLWDAALAGGGGASALLVPNASSGGATIDMGASFGALCAATLTGLGCAAGQQTVLTDQSLSADGAYHCRCGGAYDQGSVRAQESIIDAVLRNVSLANASSTNFICDNYAPLCNAYLDRVGCSALLSPTAGRSVVGCNVASPTLNLYIGTCSCAAPFVSDVASDRIAELLYDRLARQALAALQPPVSAAPGGTNFSAAYAQVCTQAANAAGCPASKLALSATPPLACSCGNFHIADGRTAELIVDAVLANASAAAAAQFAAAVNPPAAHKAAGPGNVGLIAAVAVLAAALAAISVAHGVCAYRRWRGVPLPAAAAAQGMANRGQRVAAASKAAEVVNPVGGGIAMTVLPPAAAPGGV